MYIINLLTKKLRTCDVIEDVVHVIHRAYAMGKPLKSTDSLWRPDLSIWSWIDSYKCIKIPLYQITLW